MTVFDFIRQKVSIFDVVAKRVSIKRIGGYWKGSCPFHMETDASFTISPDKGIFYCFGCHESGDAVAFVAKHESLTAFEAVQQLVAEHGLEIPPSLLNDKSGLWQKNDSTDLAKKACKIFAQWTNEQLKKNPHAYNYLLARGISDQSIERFCLGYFPMPEAENIELLLAYAQAHGLLAQDLIKAGILGGQPQLWSPFVGRIIFPIRQHDGKTIAFGGRIIAADDTRPKYYNSKESEIFHKGSVLFGFDLAKQELRQNMAGFLVEGYLDCVMMSQSGFIGTFATLGTSCTANHLKLIARHLKTLFVVYDADRAGIQAVLKLAKICWEVEVELKVIVLPAGQDPASFLSQGGDLKPLQAQAAGIFEFFLQKNAEHFMGKSLADKIEIIREVLKTVLQLQDVVKRDLLMLEISRTFQVPLPTLKKQALTARANAETLPQNSKTRILAATSTQAQASDQALSLSQQIWFMLMLAEQAGYEEFKLFDNITTLFEPQVALWHKLWLKCSNVENNQEKFKLFLQELSTEEQNLVLKGMLLCEQLLEPRLFNKLQQELKKRHLKQLILGARQTVASNNFSVDEKVELLQQISQLSKKVKTKE